MNRATSTRFFEVIASEQANAIYYLIVGRSGDKIQLEDERENQAVLDDLSNLVHSGGCVFLQSVLDGVPITIAGTIMSAEKGMRPGRFIVRLEPVGLGDWKPDKIKRAYCNLPALMAIGLENVAFQK